MKKHNRRTGIALLLCLVLSLQMCLPPSAVLAEEGGNQDGATEVLPEIDYSVGGYDGTYDGQPHSITLTVSTPDVTVSYASSENSTYTAANPSFTEVGSYTVYFRLEKEGYQSEEGSVGVQINPVNISEQVRAGLKSSYAYTGSPVQFDLPYDKIKEWSIVYVNSDGEPLDTPVDPGSYTVNISGEGGSYYANVNHTFTIVKVKEEIQYTASGYSGVYDGDPHAITVDVTNEGATVTYAASADGTYGETNPAYTDAGEYTVYFKIEKQDCETKTGSATVTIAKADVSSQVVFDGEDFYTYTGSPVNFSISCAGIDTWTYTYFDGNSTQLGAAPSAVGCYTVEISGEGKNYTAKVTHSYSIIAAEMQYTASGYTGVYDGKAHTITVSVTTEGAAVTYAADSDGPYTAEAPTFTDVGEYPIWYRIEKENYMNVMGCATVTITKADVSDQVIFDKQDSYAYTGEPVAFAPSCEGIDEWTYTYYENDTKLDAAPGEPGSYRVEIIGEGVNHTAKVTHAYSITPAGFQYTVSGYTGVYDGEAHTITLNVTTEGAAVTYTTSEDGEYTANNPAFTDAGMYTVWYRIEKDNYTPVTGSATVTIAKADVSDQVSFVGQDTYTYNGIPVVFIPSCDGITDWTITYHDQRGAVLSKAPSKAGSYSVEMKGEGTNCIAQVTHDYSIVQEKIVYTVSGYNGAYDGQPYAITVNVTTPGAWVTYATSKDGTYSEKNPEFTDVGTYTVYFKVEKWYCESRSGSATVTITKADLSDKVSFNKQDSYPYTGAPVVFSPACDGIASWKFIYYDKYGTKLSAAPSKVGSYKVEMYGESANCYARVWHTYIISDPIDTGSILYKAKGYSAEYDGKAHSIDLAVSTPDVTVTYAIDQNSEYSATKPEFTNAGTYTVRFRLEKPNYTTVENSATVTITQCTPKLYFDPYNIVFQPGEKSRQLIWVYTGDGKVTFTSSDTNHFWVDPVGGLVSLKQEGGVFICATASETRNCKSVTATCIVETESTLPQINIDTNLNKQNPAEKLESPVYIDKKTDLTLRPVSDADSKSLLGASSALREKLMAAVGSGQIGTMTVDASLIDSRTGEEIHNISSDLLISFTDDLRQRYLANYENMSCIAVHIKQDSTTETAAPTATPTPSSTAAHEMSLGNGGYFSDSDLGIDIGSSGGEQLLVRNSDGLTVAPIGSLSSKVELIPCKLTREGVLIPDTTTSPFLLIYGPKEAFSNLLTVRAKDGVFTWDGEGHQVAAEPSIKEGTTLWYSLDLETWQTEAPVFTDVLRNEDGSVGSYQVYVLAENPDCDPAVCSYTVTINPA